MKQLFFKIVFYIIITPIGLITRLFGVKFVDKGFDNTKSSYWNIDKNRSSSVNIKKYKNQL